jgi:hypothetical protein
MLAGLRHHPFGVEAFFRRSYGDHGFLAIALVQTEGLRPTGSPRMFGRNFFLSGYRIFTRFPRPGRSELRGLKILRSDTDRRSMKVAGNLFTHYAYRVARVSSHADAGRWRLEVDTPGREANLRLEATLQPRPAALPPGSVFRSMEDALAFAGPLPFTFSYEATSHQMVVIKGVRKTWAPQSVAVRVDEATFFESSAFAAARPVLSNAFFVENTPYRWERGTLEEIAP